MDWQIELSHMNTLVIILENGVEQDCIFQIRCSIEKLPAHFFRQPAEQAKHQQYQNI